MVGVHILFRGGVCILFRRGGGIFTIPGVNGVYAKQEGGGCT